MSQGDRGITVRTTGGTYTVLVGAGLLDGVGQLTVHALGRSPGRAMLVADDGVPRTLVDRAEASLSGLGIDVTRVSFASSEQTKTLRHLESIVAEAARLKLERFDPIVAIGGGVVGDVVGFAAATYRRGVPVIQCPTTLLSMVDASVGGKTGVNLEVRGALLKNMVGAFHQPTLVLADVEMLHSLPPRHLSSGLAECLKHGLLSADFGDPGLFEWTRANLPALRALDLDALAELVLRNVRVKAAVVGQDERELAPEGGRALLNLGHTFAHAIETIDGLTPDGIPAHAPLHHGEAVGLGLVAATFVAVAQGLAGAELQQEVESALHASGLPSTVRNLPSSLKILERMQSDKKVLQGTLRLVLPCAGRRATVAVGIPREHILDAIDRIRS